METVSKKIKNISKLKNKSESKNDVLPSAEQIELIKEFPLFKSKQLSQEFIIKHFKRLWHFFEDRLNCLNNGSEKCSNSEGFHSTFEIGPNNALFVNLYRCPKLQQKLDVNKFKENYLVCQFNMKTFNKLRWNLNWIKLLDSRKPFLYYLSKIVSGEIKSGYFLHGSPGIGKTYMTICACNSMAKAGKKIAYIYSPQLVQDLRFNEKNLIWRQTINENLKEADILVIDDLGAEHIYDSKWLYNGFLDTILNSRMEANKVTLFISNYSLDDFVNKLRTHIFGQQAVDEIYIQRLISRIKSLIDLKDFLLKGKDMRF